jgi:hypothetical protein
MELAEELRTGVQELLTSDRIEIREDGGRLTPASPLSWEVRGALGKPLLQLWAENCNLTRRVVAIAEQEESRLVLAVERFGRARPERLEIVRLKFQRDAKAILREDFCASLRRILAEQFPDETVERLPSPRTWNIPSLASMHGESRARALRAALFSLFRKENQGKQLRAV